MENGSCSTGYSAVALVVSCRFAEATALCVESFLRKRLAGSEKCCTFASANGEERLTLVSFRLFQPPCLSFFKGLVFIGRVAQLNRAFDYGSKGCRFESCRGHKKSLPRWEALFAFIGQMRLLQQSPDVSGELLRRCEEYRDSALDERILLLRRRFVCLLLDDVRLDASLDALLLSVVHTRGGVA